MSAADQVVGDHEQGHVADRLARRRDLDDVAEQLIDLGIDFGRLRLQLVGQAQRPRLLIEVGVLPPGHLVAVKVRRRRQHDAFERRVELAHRLPVIGNLSEPLAG